MKRKRFLCLLLGLALVFSLAACAEKGADPSGSTGPSGASDPSGSEPTVPAVDLTAFSKGLDERGYFQGLTALDCVTLPAYEDVDMPEFAHVTSGRVISDGDFVNIGYVGTVAGVAFAGGSIDATDIVVGYTSYIDDFIEQLKGHAPGENFDIEVTFPDPYQNDPDLAGKDAVFNITVNFIWDVTEEKAKTIGFTGLDGMRQYVASGYGVEQLVSDARLNVFAAACEVNSIPDEVLSTVRELISTTVTANAALYGMDVATYLSYAYGTDSLDAVLDDQTRPTAEMYVILQAVAEREGIVPTDEDAAEAGFTEYVEDYGKPYVMFNILQRKISTLITEKLTGETQ